MGEPSIENALPDFAGRNELIQKWLAENKQSLEKSVIWLICQISRESIHAFRTNYDRAIFYQNKFGGALSYAQAEHVLRGSIETAITSGRVPVSYLHIAPPKY